MFTTQRLVIFGFCLESTLPNVFLRLSSMRCALMLAITNQPSPPSSSSGALGDAFSAGSPSKKGRLVCCNWAYGP